MPNDTDDTDLQARIKKINRERDLDALKIIRNDIKDGKGTEGDAASIAAKYPGDSAFEAALKGIADAKKDRELKDAEQKAIENAARNAPYFSAAARKDYTDYVNKDPLKANREYFADEKVAESTKVIDDVLKGIPTTTQKFASMIDTNSSQEHIEKREILSDATAIKVEKLKQQHGTTADPSEKAKIAAEMSEQQEFLAKHGKAELMHHVTEHWKDKFKHKNRREPSNEELAAAHKTDITNHFKELATKIEHGVEGGFAAVGSLIKHEKDVIKRFVGSKDTGELQAAIEERKRLNAAKAASMLEEERIEKERMAQATAEKTRAAEALIANLSAKGSPQGRREQAESLARDLEKINTNERNRVPLNRAEGARKIQAKAELAELVKAEVYRAEFAKHKQERERTGGKRLSNLWVRSSNLLGRANKTDKLRKIEKILKLL